MSAGGFNNEFETGTVICYFRTKSFAAIKYKCEFNIYVV